MVGPAYREVANRYAEKGDAVVAMLAQKIRTGGADNWGEVPMTAHPDVSDADATSMVTRILSLHGAGAASAGAATAGKTAVSEPAHTYKDTFGKSVQTDVAIFTGTDQKSVTPEVLEGYEKYNTCCARCHGVDAIGGVYAPNLRKSMENGLIYQQFIGTVMEVRQGKGMPAWAGVFEAKDIHAIYAYIKARQLSLISGGAPLSGGHMAVWMAKCSRVNSSIRYG